MQPFRIKKSCNLLGQKKSCNLSGPKNCATPWDKKIEKPLETNKNHVTFGRKKNHATSWDEKKHHATSLYKKIMQPIGTKTRRGSPVDDRPSPDYLHHVV